MFTAQKDARLRARASGAIALVIATTALTSCAAGGPSPVGFEDVQTATIQIQAQGTFIDPGTTQPSETAGRGSGFLIDPSGIALTNNHVVVGAGTLKVWLGGDTGKQYNATVLGASECLDLAVIQLDKGTYPFVGWYQGEIKTALDVYSAGFPLGDPNFTLTRGIVSKADVPQDDSWASLDHVIEHDARIRGGNSGGPLVADNGRVVGVNYAGNDELDYNYAIHRDEVLAVIDDLKKGKPVLSLGINAQAMAPSEDGTPNGIWVSSLQAGGPADKAGIEAGDVLISLAGITLGAGGTLEDYCQVIRTQGVDATIDVSVYRPSTDEMLDGQLNGSALKVTATGVLGGGQQEVGSFVTVTDDSGAVSVSVPNTWSAVDGAGFTDQEGNSWASVTATPDRAGFDGSWGTPGVIVAATAASAMTVDAALALLSSGLEAECTPLDVGTGYDDGLYVGTYNSWTGCGGGSTDYYVLAATETTGTHLVAVVLQLVSDFDKSTVLQNVVSSFQVAS
ncbi:MAG: serine protease [Rhodoglobus sp.]|nr:serine protease [Rhodoglobus sp.]